MYSDMTLITIALTVTLLFELHKKLNVRKTTNIRKNE